MEGSYPIGFVGSRNPVGSERLLVAVTTNPVEHQPPLIDHIVDITAAAVTGDLPEQDFCIPVLVNMARPAMIPFPVRNVSRRTAFRYFV